MTTTYVSNSYANKPSLVSTMSSLLTYTYSQSTPALTGNSNVISVSAANNNNYVIQFLGSVSGMFLGACYTAGSVTFMICGSCTSAGVVDSTFNNSSSYYLVDSRVNSLTSATAASFQSIASSIYPSSTSATVEDILNLFLAGPSQKLYSFAIASIVAAINNDLSTYNTAGARILTTIDDGSVFIDTSKITVTTSGVAYLGTSSAPILCTYQNFVNKIKILGVQSNLTSSNGLLLTDNSSNTVTLTAGSAGGNNINENHNTRPEILLSLLSNSGVGFAQRYSSSTSSFNFYYAVRIGTVAEFNVGTIRVNFPALLKITT